MLFASDETQLKQALSEVVDDGCNVLHLLIRQARLADRASQSIPGTRA